MSDAAIEGLPRWSFGDSPAMADALLALVLSGAKTATCGSLAACEGEPWWPIRPGDRSVVLDGAGRPACVLETVDVALRRFDDVDQSFARDEGEGDLSLGWWRDAHRRYFERNGGWSPDMTLVCERFRVVRVLDRGAAP